MEFDCDVQEPGVHAVVGVDGIVFGNAPYSLGLLVYLSVLQPGCGVQDKLHATPRHGHEAKQSKRFRCHGEAGYTS